MGTPASAAAAPSPFVKRAGTKLVLKGKPYRFTGLNIYNANSRGECWYAMSSGPTLSQSLEAIGPGKEAFRAWFFQSLATTGGQRDWRAFDHTLSVARAHGVKVIATLTNQWGDCEAGGYKADSWYTNGYKQLDPGGVTSYRKWVAQVVSRYRNNPTILAWQLINEAEVKPSRDVSGCSPNPAATLKSFATDVSGLDQVDRPKPPRQPRDDRRRAVRHAGHPVPERPQRPDDRSLRIPRLPPAERPHAGRPVERPPGPHRPVQRAPQAALRQARRASFRMTSEERCKPVPQPSTPSCALSSPRALSASWSGHGARSARPGTTTTWGLAIPRSGCSATTEPRLNRGSLVAAVWPSSQPGYAWPDAAQLASGPQHEPAGTDPG